MPKWKNYQQSSLHGAGNSKVFGSISGLPQSECLLFTIGFSRDVIDKVPVDDVTGWTSEAPEKRASIVAHLASKDFSSDETLASRVLGTFGKSEVVRSKALVTGPRAHYIVAVGPNPGASLPADTLHLRSTDGAIS